MCNIYIIITIIVSIYKKDYSMRYTKLHKMFATACGIAQTALIH